MRGKVSPSRGTWCAESAILFALCTLDMLISVLLFQANLAVEANPLLRPFAEAGAGAFVTVKTLTFLPAIGYLEWLRRSRPGFAVGLLRCGSIGYAAIYGVGALVQCL